MNFAKGLLCVSLLTFGFACANQKKASDIVKKIEKKKVSKILASVAMPSRNVNEKESAEDKKEVIKQKKEKADKGQKDIAIQECVQHLNALKKKALNAKKAECAKVLAGLIDQVANGLMSPEMANEKSAKLMLDLKK